MEPDKVTLAEYAEAGAAGRAQEQHVRTALASYVVLSAAAITVAFSANLGKYERLAVDGLLFAIGLLTWHLVSRSQAIYRVYIERAREIEKKLQMALYSKAFEELHQEGVLPNKTAIKATVGFLIFYFIVDGFVVALK